MLFLRSVLDTGGGQVANAKNGKAARGTAYFALTCLLAAMLLIVRFKRPACIVVEAMPEQESAAEAQIDETGTQEAGFTEAYQAKEAVQLPQGQNAEEQGKEGKIYVHVAGCVEKPGLYELKQGARVNDALLAAGGMTKSADSDSVNIALPVKDGQQVYIPTRQEQQTVNAGVAKSPQEPQQAPKDWPQPSPPLPPPDRLDVTKDAPEEEATAIGASPTAKVDINSAGIDELDTLPGIGPSTAAKIIEYRENNGPFTSVEQLMDVSGIGPAKFEAIREMVVAGR